MIWKYVIYSLFEAKIFTVAAKLKALAHTPPEVGAQACLCVEGVNNLFSNHFRILCRLETWIMQEEL